MADHAPRNFEQWMRSIERRTSSAHLAGSALAQTYGEKIRDDVLADTERRPAAPVEITYQSALYTEGGLARQYARIDVEFPDVTRATDGTVIPIIQYELWGRDDTTNYLNASTSAVPGVAAPGLTMPGLAATQDQQDRAADAVAPFQRLATSPLSSLRHSGMIPGSVWTFRIRAIGQYTTMPGDWSEDFQTQLDIDTTPPPQPTAPELISSRGTITVKWDGLAVSGAMPADLSHVVVAAATSSSPTLQVDLFYRGGGLTVLSGAEYYRPVFVRFQAVDQSGNRSPWSEQATAYTVPLVDEDVILSEIDAAHTLIKNIGAESLKDGAVLAEKLADNAVTQAKLADSAITLAKLDTVVNDKIQQGITDAFNASQEALAADGKAGTAQDAADAARRVAEALIASGVSLVRNGGFETDDVWPVHAAQYYDTAQKRSGARSMKLVPAAGNVWPTSDWVEGSTGRTYRLAYWILKSGTDNPALSSIGTVVQAKTTAGGTATLVAYGTPASPAEISTTEFTKVTVDYTITTADTVQVRFAPWVRQSTNLYWVDDFSVVDITDAKAALDAAKAAQDRADAAFADAAEALELAGLAQDSADGNVKVYYTGTAPSGTGHPLNSIWFQSPGNKVHLWGGDSWEPRVDAAIATAQQAATAAGTAASTADGKAVAAQADADQALLDADAAKLIADQAVLDADAADQKGADAQLAADAAKLVADQAILDADAAAGAAGAASSVATAAASAAATADGKAVTAKEAADAAALVASKALPKIISGASQKTFYELASVSVNSGSGSIGELIIQTGIPYNINYMCRIDVQGFTWDTLKSEVDATIAFYTNGGAISNAGFSSLGSLAITQVRIMRNTATDTIVLVLSCSGGRYNYIKASVVRALVGYATPPDSVGDGWAMGVGTDLSAYTLLTTLTVSRDLNDTHALTQGWRTTGQTTIDGGKITADSVTAGQIAANAITASEIAADAVTAAKIKAGEITAAKLVAGTLTSASGVFGEVDANILNAGTLNAARIAAGSIAANKLVIGSGANALPDPAFSIPELLTARLARSSGFVPGWSVGTPTAAGIRSVTRTTSTANDSFHYAPYTPDTGLAGMAIQASAGQKWLLEVDVETDVSAGVRWNVYRYAADGTESYVSLSPYSTGAGKRKLSYVWTVPAGCVAFELALACNTLGAVWTVYGTGIAALQAGATLIEDGAITTPKILTDAVVAAHIKAGEITAGKLVAGTLTSASGVFGAVDANILTAGTIDAARLNAGDIRAAFLTAGKVTAADIVAGTLTSASGVFGTMDASVINAGTLNAARLDAGTIRAKFLEAGKVTAADMIAGTITAGSGVIGSLDIGKVTTGELSGSFITAKSLTAEKLLISRGANLLTDPDIQDLPGWSSNASTTPRLTDGRTGRGSVLIANVPTQEGSYYGMADNSRRTRLVAGSTYRITAWAYPSAEVPVNGLKLYLRTYNDGAGFSFAAEVPGSVAQNSTVLAANTWHQITGLASVPLGTANTNGVLGMFKQSFYNTGTVIFSDPTLQQAMAGELIVDGTVTAAKVDAQSVAGAVGQFIELDVSQLNASTASMDQATIDKLWTDVVRAKKITTDMMVVSGTNMVPDPFFLDDAQNTYRLTSTGTFALANDDQSVGKTIKFTDHEGAGSYRSLNLHSDVIGMIEVTPGASYTLSVRYRLRGNVVAGQTSLMRFAMYHHRPDGSYLRYVGVGSYETMIGTGATWATFTSPEYVMPNDVKYIRLQTQFNNAGYTGEFEVKQPLMRAMADSALVVAGGITATQLATDSVTAAKIKALEITAGKIAANAIEADKIKAGAVTANKLEATLILGSTIIAGAPTGTHAKMDQNGFRVFAADAATGVPKEVIRMGVAATDDYFAITKTNNELAATIDSKGVGSFTQVLAGEQLHYKGDELTTILNRLPKGLVGWAQRTSYSPVNANNSTRVPYMRLNVKVEAGRFYKVTTSPLATEASDTTTSAVLMLNFNYAGDASPFDPFLTNVMTAHTATNEYAQMPVALSGITASAVNGYLSVMVSFQAGGSGVVGMRGSESQPAWITVEDMGPQRYQAGVNLDGVNTAPNVINYYKEYAQTAGASYTGTNAAYGYMTDKMFQGQSPVAGVGNTRSIATFQSMTTDLQNATIQEMRVFIHFDSWYYNAGGTARIGLHTHSTLPATFSHSTPDAIISAGWPRPGGRWVTIPSAYHAGFKSGLYKGISLLAPANDFQYYGYAAENMIISAAYTK